MRRVTKRILQCFLWVLLTFAMVVPFIVKVKAAWGGPSTLSPYPSQLEEMRAIWVATVGNLDMPQQEGTNEVAIQSWKNFYLGILDKAEENNMNTIIFQIRPENDAFYPSKYNPWSKYLVAYGTNPGWDPLKWMIEVTHERGMDYHAWLNPYRASNGTLTYDIVKDGKVVDGDIEELNAYKSSYFGTLKNQTSSIDNPVFASGEKLHHNVVYGTEGKFILNPASETVRTHIENTISEIIDNYDIDGIHFDDYFYPDDKNYNGSVAEYKGYTYSCEPWVDTADYKAYVNGGGSLNVYDWRRENINLLIQGLGQLIREKNQTKKVKCAFGISPSARWAPTIEACSATPYRGAEGGMAGSCNNYYSYSDLYADTYKWAIEEWIDYLVPQNYTNLAGDYPDIAKWWSDALRGSRTKLYIGTPLYLVSSSWGDSGMSEIYYQLLYNATKKYEVDGYVLFRYGNLLTQIGGSAMSPIKKYAWKNAALTPLYDAYTYEKVVKEKSTVKKIEMNTETEAVVSFEKVEGAKGYGIYQANKNENFVFDEAHLVGRKLQGKTQMTISYDANKKYALVVYDQDHSLYNEYTELDFTTAIYKEKPKFEKIGSVDNEVLIRKTIDVYAKVTDTDSPVLDYTIDLIEPNREYTLKTGKTSTGEIRYTWNVPNYTIRDAYIRITITDGNYQVIEQTNVFQVVNQYTNLPSEVTLQMDKQNYKQGETAQLNVQITDPDSETFTLNVWYAHDGINYTTCILENISLNTKTHHFSFAFPNTSSVRGSFKVEVNDGNCTQTAFQDVQIWKTSAMAEVTGIEDVKLNGALNLFIKAKDGESSTMKYKVYYAKDGVNFDLEIASGEMANGEAAVAFFATELTENGKFRIVLEDGESISEIFTNDFKVMNPTSEKPKGCTCKKSTVYFQYIAGALLLVMLFRKRGLLK